MQEEQQIIDIDAEDSYWSETLQQDVYSYHCPQCKKWGFVSRPGDTNRCECGTFLRVNGTSKQ